MDRTLAALRQARWPVEAAREWYAGQPWLCGFNYLPASAVNFIEMWQDQTFDPERIERELSWAADIGFNSLRTNLPFVVWSADRDRLLERFERFLSIAASKGMKTVVCLMDDCAFSGLPSHAGPQGAPIVGVHNSRAVASPGRERVVDTSTWPEIERYVRDVVVHYRNDDRVLMWDIYNEPGNLMVFTRPTGTPFGPELEEFSRRLMIEAFGWCREIAPRQPITVGAWQLSDHPHGSDERVYPHSTDRAALALSDVVTFHAYTDLPRMERIVAELDDLDRPVLCTEWMARHAGSRIESVLPMFKARGIGCWQWGFVNGRTQTHLPWPVYADAASADGGGRAGWFHDLLHVDGTAYDETEVAIIRQLTGRDARTD